MDTNQTNLSSMQLPSEPGSPMRGKVLFLLSRFLDGGIDTVLVEYLNALVSQTSYEVTLCINVCMEDLEVYKARIPKGVKVVYLVENRLLTWYKRRKITHGKSLLGIGDELLLNPIRRSSARHQLHEMSSGYDVIIDFDCTHGSFLKGIHGPRMISFYHFSLDAVRQHDARHLRRQIAKMSVYDKVVLLSDAMLKEAQVLMPELKDHFHRIYNPVDLQRIIQRAQEPVNDDRINKPFMLTVARLEENQKDLTTLINAYSLLRGSNVPKLYIVGEGHSRVQLQNHIDTFGLRADVVLLGFQENPYPWMAKAKLLLLSSKFEGLPTVLIEGLMLGKLMAATDCPTGPSEILDHGQAGVLVPVGSTSAMRDAMLEILNNNKLQTSLLKNVEERRWMFSPQSSVSQLCALF